MRGSYWKTKLKKLGQDTLIDQGVSIWGANKIEIGAHCIIGYMVQISCGGGQNAQSKIFIGDYCFIGPSSFIGGCDTIIMNDYSSLSAGVRVYSASNLPTHPKHPGQLMSMAHAAPADQQYEIRGKVEIGTYAFVGINSIILPQVTLGRGSIVHPYTEVTKSFPSFANIMGPGKARQIGWRRPLRLDPRREKIPSED
jgi:galactoside O-acetyltransferase